ncbi:MAG: hypothetical protein U9N02_07625, partial [Campylobacterota bacterium]|nr:hypothetical protein [Campylobacterota bacterium]
MKKLSIAIDMGAKNNGVFIVETDGEVILNKKACCVVVDGKLINFSKKDRRENRHKDRNYKRRNQAKRFLKEVIDFNKLDEKQTENIMGLLNNRGYTFLSSSSEFEELQNETLEFSEVYLKEIQKHKSKYDFESFFTNEFEDEKKLVIFLNNQIDKIQKIVDELDIYMKKNDILKNIEALEINSSIKKIDSYTKGIIDKYDIKFEYKDENNNIKEKKLSSLKTEEILKKIIDYKIDLASINFIAEKKIIFEIENKFTNYYCMIKESLEQNNKKLKKREIEHNFKQITNSVFLDLVGKGQKDYNGLKGFLEGIKKEIQTGSKPRKKYIKEIKEEIDKLDFIDDKDSFTNLIANISNLQLRVLRKFFNFNSQKNDRYEILKKYFISHHYKKDSEKQTKKDLFIHLEKNKTLIDFLQNTPPHLSIPPYEDMNNRNTYKCNSMLIRPEFITDDMKLAIDKILENEYFSWLLATENYGVFEKENEQRVKPATNNQYLKKDFTYSKYLQRILDATEERTTKELNPRNVFKHKKMLQRGKISCVKEFKKVFGEDIYITLENIASRFYSEEMKINNGIYEKTTSIFDKCNTNTSYKENVKHTLLKPVYSHKFTPKQAESFIIEIESKRGLKTALELISNEAKKYQNSFYNTILACYENQKYSNDKELIKIVNKLDENIKSIKEIFTKIDVKDSFINGIEKVNKENITKVINVLKQTYEILFKELKGFSKTCKHCTKENAIRSDEKLVIAKRLLSDVAKPIDGMLDMMLDRLAYEISE